MMAKKAKWVAKNGICDLCHRGPKRVPYRTADGSGHVCDTCYHNLYCRECAICQKVKLIIYKNPEGKGKICSDCYRKRKGDYSGICPECGQEGQIHYQGPKTRICRKCRDRFRVLECLAGVLGGRQGAVVKLNVLINSKSSRIRVKEVLWCISLLQVPRLKDGILLFCGTPSGAELKILCDEIGLKWAGR